MKFFNRLYLLGIFLFSGLAMAANPIGYWQLKDKTDRPIMIIRIFQDEQTQTLSAKIIEYLPNANARCTNCQGENENQPIRGLNFITGLQADGANQWSSGKILNPMTGKVNKVQIKINASGTELVINSYGFLSWFGSADVWTRRK